MDRVIYAPMDPNADAATNNAILQAALDSAPVPQAGLSDNDVPATVVEMPPGRFTIIGEDPSDEGPIRVPTNVWLRGHGPSSTVLVSRSFTKDMIVLKTGSEVQVTLSDFGLIGRGMMATAGAGIHLVGNGAGSILFDSRHAIRDIMIVQGFRGIYTEGAGNETRISRVTVQRTRSVGIECGFTDAFLSDVTVGACMGSPGIRMLGGNSRLWGCKVYGGAGVGFALAGAGRHELSCCEAQDCVGAGFNAGGNTNVLTGIMVDSCGGGVNLESGAANARVEGAVIYRGGGKFKPAYGLRSGVRRCHASLTVFDATGVNPFRELLLVQTVPQSNDSNRYEISNQEGYQKVAYAPSIVPNPFFGGSAIVAPLVGPLAIQNPATPGASHFVPGTRLSFVLPQGAGGNAVTFGAAYKITGPVDTAPSSTTRIGFEFDGVNWNETGRSVVV